MISQIYLFVAWCPTWAYTLFRLSYLQVVDSFRYLLVKVNAWEHLLFEKRRFFFLVWLGKEVGVGREENGWGRYNILLFLSVPTSLQHSYRFQQARGAGLEPEAKGCGFQAWGHRNPDDKHSMHGVGNGVSLPTSTLLQNSKQILHPYSGQPYAKFIMLKSICIRKALC